MQQDTPFNRRLPVGEGIISYKLYKPDYSKGTVLMVHGFPDYSYSWRHQIEPLTRNNFTVIVPDLPGFNDSKFPVEDLTNFTQKFTTSCFVSILDHEKIDRAIFIGHDWGGSVIWSMHLFHPERVMALASLCTPFNPTLPKFLTLEEIVRVRPQFGYQLYFSNKNSGAREEFLQNTDKFFRLMFLRSDAGKKYKFFENKKQMLPKSVNIELQDLIVSEEELNEYVETFKKTTFDGPLNWYSTRELNWKDETEKLSGKGQRIKVPCLMITAGKDKVLTRDMSLKMERYIDNLSRHHVEEAGHWPHVERKDEVNKVIIEWLNNLYSKSKL